LEQTEPGHPAPLFLKRAERLLGLKDFFAIISDMAPDALSEMEKITGYRLEVTDQ
jgi:type VI secretion system protein ImpA